MSADSQMYYDRTKQEYRLFSDSFVDNNLGLKMTYRDMCKHGYISKLDFWKCVHDLPHHIVVGWRIRVKLFFRKVFNLKDIQP